MALQPDVAYYEDEKDLAYQEMVAGRKARPDYSTRLLTRQQFKADFELTEQELRLLLRREDFVRLCCLTTESGEVARIIPGQVRRWLYVGDWRTSAEAARAQSWAPIVAQVCEAFLKAVRTPGL